MKKRPIQILLVAFAQILNPVMSVLINCLYFHTTPQIVLRSAWYGGTWSSRITFFALGPLLALSIYAVKRWSFPVFTACIAFTAYENLQVWRIHPAQVSLTIVAALVLTNLALVAYFLLPQVRIAYFDRSVRWWENKPRYQQYSAVQVSSEKGTFAASILNISEGGVLLVTEHSLTSGQNINFKLEDLSTPVNFTGRVVYGRTVANMHGYGVQFLHTAETRKEIKKHLRNLRAKGVPSNVEPRNLWVETKALARDIFTKGEGFVPSPSPKTPRALATTSDKINKNDKNAA